MGDQDTKNSLLIYLRIVEKLLFHGKSTSYGGVKIPNSEQSYFGVKQVLRCCPMRGRSRHRRLLIDITAGWREIAVPNLHQVCVNFVWICNMHKYMQTAIRVPFLPCEMT